ncbi:MAG: phosphoethanolamine transferase [Alphaproteobacteria bacterium]|nr:phosphoethanolamine transferase [Alphaproteobacteria bacterium]
MGYIVKKVFVLFYAVMSIIMACISIYCTTIGNVFTFNHLSSIVFFVGIFFFSFFSASLLMSIKLKSKTVSFLIKIASIILLSLPGIIYLIHILPYITVEKALTSADVLAFLKTYRQESYIYFFSNVKWGLFAWNSFIFVLFVLSSILFAIKYKPEKNKVCKNTVMLSVGVMFCIVFICNPLIEPIKSAITTVLEYRTYEKMNMQKKTVAAKINKNNKGIYVVIIGDSQNREHMSVYGYDRKTTPFLSSQKNNTKEGKWIFFNQPYACYTHTVEVMTRILTDINSFNSKKLTASENIIDILHNNNYQTWWISNHKKGGNAFSVAPLVSQVQNQIWLNEPSKRDPYDEIVLNKLPFETELNDASVVFIHLLGSHLGYRDRYPEAKAQFRDGPHDYVDHYDNSILYNDYIISKIYNHFKSMKNFSALIYTSDHSDDVDSGFCSHNASLFTWDMVKIPLFSFFSNDYIKNNRSKIKNLETNQNMPFVNEMLFDTLLGIIGIEDKAYILQNDLSSSQYNHSYDTLYTLLGKKKLSDEKNDIALNNRFKIYLHKVNSPQKLQELREKYIGFELDIVFHENEKSFENSDNKTNLGKYPLEETLKYYRWWQKLWFDFKNLSQTNKEEAKKKLEHLIKEYRISKSAIWLESTDLDALESFTQSGWNTTYQMNYDFASMSRAEVKKIKKQIEDISYSGKVKAISFDERYYSFINRLNLNPQIFLHVKYKNQTFTELKDKDAFLSVLENPKVKVVLVKEHGKYHR